MKKLKKFWAWIRADRKRLVIGIVILLVLLFAGWKLSARKNTQPQYQTATVQKGTIVSTVSASGSVLSSHIIDVSTSASGIVKNVYVKDGQKVVAGQKIADIQLDSDGALKNAQAYASLISASNAVNAANNSYRSTQSTVENILDQVKGHSADETFAQKEARTKAEVANDNSFDSLRSSKANLASAGLSYRLNSPVITAPSTGTIDNITITPGMVLSGSASSATVAASSNRVAVVRSTGNPILSFNVSEIDISHVKQGQKATVTVDSLGDKTFTGKVLTIDRIGVTSSSVTNYPVTIGLDTSSDEILPNMSVTANIILETKTDVLTVPSSTVTTLNGETVAKVLRNGVEIDLPVEIGLSNDTDIEIKSGLNEGDTVITGTTTGAVSATTTGSFSPFGGGFGGGAVRTGGTGGNVIRRGN